MSQSQPTIGKSQRSSNAELARLWAGHLAIAAAVGAAYFLVAKVTSWGTAFQPDNVSLFWPPTGISSGLLIVLGPRRRWSAVVGLVVAAAIIGQESWSSYWIALAIAVCNAVEALTVVGVVDRYFGGANFALDRTRNIFGLLGAAVVGAAVSALIATVVLRLVLGPSIMALSTWRHWFTSVLLGIVTVTPLVVGLAEALRRPPSRREYVEGTSALFALVMVTLVAVSLPPEIWDVLLPVAWPFPILLWLSARSRPIFAAAGAFLVSNIIVWTTTFGIGHFGDARLPLDDRVLQAQTAILFLAVSAYILAALFAERRESEALLARSNAMLLREKRNKLATAKAAAASIAHELRQPLAAMSMNADTSLIYLDQTPPNLSEAKNILNDIIADARRSSEIIEGICALFEDADQYMQSVNVNEIFSEVLHSMRAELSGRGIAVESKLAEIPPIHGNRTQLRQVIFNLANNAVEAMAGITGRNRVLRLITQRGDRDRIVVAVQDTGPGIAPERLDDIFDAFVTTKPQGAGLGLAICQVIVERHGGELTAFSDGKNGALFQFSLPIKPTNDAAAPV